MTRHDDLAPRNRLAAESSPYLLLHASNPVDWHPWGEEAFAKARSENKPIFLSVGYSTCYWCHVMEREVFSDEAIAAQMNDGFVSIKLDREERPDLDEIYMTATQLLTRSGGWPNSVFLTHDLAPFFAGTYFPPRDWRGRPGFPRILQSVREAWALRRAGVEDQGRVLAQAIREQLASDSEAPADVDPASEERLFAALDRRFDPLFGGFGAAPKFPAPANLFFLLERAATGDAASRKMLLTTLDRMARGGIHDQIGGGFHRYSTDASWLVPHFEKMLYDNAALARLYAEAAALEPAGDFAAVSRRTLDFILREMTSPQGGFFSAIDAETDGDEGAFYVFTRDELKAALGDDDAQAASAFGFDGAPNFEAERFVLHMPQPVEDRVVLQHLDPIREKLLRRRDTRTRPLTDDKVMTDWNGLTIAAMARAGALLTEPRYVEAGERAASFILANAKGPTGVLQHTFRGGRASIDGLLDDYAFLIEGLLELHEATARQSFLDEAGRLQEEQDTRLWDGERGGYFAAGEDRRSLVRAKPATDGAGSSGMGISVLNLARLARVTGDGSLLERARDTLRAFARPIDELPVAHATLIRAMRGLPAAPATASSIRFETGLDATALAVVEARGKLGAGTAEWRPFTLDLAIRSGWHVNANPASHEPLVPTEVSGDVRAVVYPEPDTLDSRFSSESIAVYGGYVTIAGEIRVPNGNQEPKVTVTYQACDEGRCLAPVTKDVALR